VTNGVLHGRFSYARFGTGAPVVVLPGLALRNRTPGRLLEASYRQAFQPLAADHTVSLIQRPLGLASGATTRDIALEYATVLDELGKVDLIGMSTGGLIAQQLAAERPDLVRTLTLVVAGMRLSPSGRAICERWLDLAAQGRWRRLHGGLGAAAVDGPVGQRMARTILAATGRKPSAQEMADFVTTVRADLDHDGHVDPAMPLLIVTGADDPFFEPDPRAVVYPGGHGIPKTHNKRLQADIRRHISG
jgi:pimeloyl-ACP methyl ester carboxylesterase